MPTTSSRLLALLSLLQARPDWPAAHLADRLDVSGRTVRRDVDRLRELGYPITSTRGRDGGYRLEAGTSLPPLLFDDDQAVALAVALQTVTATGAGVEEAASRALTTVRQLLPTRLRHRVDAVRVDAAPPERRGDPVAPALLATVSSAIRSHEVLRFDYATAARTDDDASPPRRAEPYHVVARGGRWYLLAWDLDRGDWRTFRLDRLRPRTPGGPRFAPRPLPGGDVAAFVTARWQGSDGLGGWPCRGEATVHAPAADVAPFADDGVVEAVAPDRCRVVLGAWSWAGLAAALARFDADLDDVRPAELVDAFGRLADRCARAAGRAAPGAL